LNGVSPATGCEAVAARQVTIDAASGESPPVPWNARMPAGEGDAVDCRPLSSSGNVGGGDRTSAANRPSADGASSSLRPRSRDAAMAASCRCCSSDSTMVSNSGIRGGGVGATSSLAARERARATACALRVVGLCTVPNSGKRAASYCLCGGGEPAAPCPASILCPYKTQARRR
jgi:hypothetical protein